MNKKYPIFFLSITILLSNSFPVQAKSFEGKEDEMNEKCININNIDVQNECLEYKEYLEHKSITFNDEISSIQEKIDKAKGNSEKTYKLIKENDDFIKSYEKQIANIQSVIKQTENSIQEVNIQINKKQEDIKKRDKLMKERMIQSQAYIGHNQYLDFLMGSTDFVDLIRRNEVMRELQEYESEEMNKLSEEKKELISYQNIVKEQKELLELQKKDIENKKQKVILLNDANKNLLVQYQKTEAELVNQKRTIQMQQANLPKIDISIADDFEDNKPVPQPKSEPTPSPEIPDDNEKPIPPIDEKPVIPSNDYFIKPLQYGWHYESGTWQYPGGGGHMGMDFSTGLQTGIPVVAPADGIIIYSYNGGCDNNGYSSCGFPWGGGNNTLLLTKKDNTIYAMPFYHLTSATKSVGTRVKQGEIIGYSGNSGNSTGPHTHVEVIRVGNMSMSDALNLYNQSGDLTFGTGWNADSPKACGVAPCRERPENYWL